jgi:hypothetical protein
MENNEILKNAQYRKSLSIAYFNSVNSAIELVSNFYPKDEKIEDIKKTIVDWRDWFLEEHKNYHATVIANIGANYKAEESIKKLQKAKDINELKTVWVGLSEDERRDGQIREELNKLKNSYEKV